ncbi:hypothetical protein [Desulfobacter postgatei]|jgi:hypothetical protein|uniref:hypothetical protein n=1 Tax=Desulfobacter postgatei TaxID=2293 RepID=UPI002A359164|nr:hypothetical protein [Desulfobacter postgatei]MDX9963955.1 hypothetical protein [Desulfobacter postgatei]
MALAIHYPKKAVKDFLETRFPETDWSEVVDQLPPIIWRSRWNELADKHGLPFRRGYMQNLDSLGCGPASFI